MKVWVKYFNNFFVIATPCIPAAYKLILSQCLVSNGRQVPHSCIGGAVTVTTLGFLSIEVPYEAREALLS
jgi:hypothetical protein